MKISLMTLTMFLRAFIKFQLDHDMEDLLETYEEMMELVSETGYEAVDVTSMETALFTLDGVKGILDKNHLKVSSYIYMACFTQMDEAGMEERIESAKKAVDTAASLGTNIIMLVPQAQSEIGEYEPKAIRAQMIKHWIPIMAYAKEKGMHAVVEDTPDLKLHFCKAEDVKEVLDAVCGLELVYDSGNMLLVEENPVEYYESFADRVGYVHLKDMRIAAPAEGYADTALDGTKMKGACTGTGMVDLKAVVKCIKRHGYEGYMTVEFANGADGDFRKNLIESRKYVEALM